MIGEWNDVVASMIPFSVYWTGKGDCGTTHLPYKVVNTNGGASKRGDGNKRPISGYSDYWKAVNENLELVKNLEAEATKMDTSYWQWIQSPLCDTVFSRFALTLHNKQGRMRHSFAKPFVLFRKFIFDDEIPEVVMVKYQLTMNITEYKIRKDFTNATTLVSLLDHWTGARRQREATLLVDRKNKRGQGRSSDDDVVVFYIKVANISKDKVDIRDPDMLSLEAESYLKAAYVQLTINSKGDYKLTYNGKTDCIVNLDPHNINRQSGMSQYALVKVVGRVLTTLIKNYNVNSHIPFSVTRKGGVDGSLLFDTDLLETFPLFTTVAKTSYKWGSNLIEAKLSVAVDLIHLVKRIRVYMSPTFRLLYQNGGCAVFLTSLMPFSVAQRKKFTIDLYHNNKLNPVGAAHMVASMDLGKKANDSMSLMFTAEFIEFFRSLYGEDPTVPVGNYRRGATKIGIDIPGVVVVYPIKGEMFTKLEIHNEVSVKRVDFIKTVILQMITANLPIKNALTPSVEMTDADDSIRHELFNYNRFRQQRSDDKNDGDDIDNGDGGDGDGVAVSDDDEADGGSGSDRSDFEDDGWDMDDDGDGGEDDLMIPIHHMKDNTKIRQMFALDDLKAIAQPKIPQTNTVLDFKDPRLKNREAHHPGDSVYRQVHNVYPQRRIDPLLYSSVDRKDKALGLPYSQQYGNLCKASTGAIPIILSDVEWERQKDKLVNSSGAPLTTLKMGTSRVVYDNYRYACPEIWCPITRQAYSLAYFNDQLGGKCPDFNGVPQSAIDFRSGTATNQRDTPYITTPANPPHPLASNKIDNGTAFMYPCCGQLRAENTQKDPNKKLFNIEVLEPNETTLLPSEFVKQQFKTSASDVYVRFAGKTRSFVEHALEIIGIKSTDNPNGQLADLVEKNMTPFEFVMLNGGTSVKRWLSTGLKLGEAGLEGNQWWRRNDRTKAHHISTTDRTSRALILKAFVGFLAYLRDDTYVKTHIELHHLFSERRNWLNRNGVRLVVFTFKFDHEKRGANSVFDSHYVSPFSTKPKVNTPIGVIITTDLLSYNRVIVKATKMATFITSNLPIHDLVADENRDRLDAITDLIVLKSGCGWKDREEYNRVSKPVKKVVLSWDFVQVGWTAKNGELVTRDQILHQSGVALGGEDIPLFVKNVDELSFVSQANFGTMSDYYDLILLQSNAETGEELVDGAFVKYRQMYMLPPKTQKALRTMPVDAAHFVQILTGAIEDTKLATTTNFNKALLAAFALHSPHCPLSLKKRVEQLMETFTYIAAVTKSPNAKFEEGLAMLKGLDPSLLKTFVFEVIGLGSMKDTHHAFFEAFYGANTRTHTEGLKYIWLTQQDIMKEKLKEIVEDLKHYRFENQTQMTLEDNRV